MIKQKIENIKKKQMKELKISVETGNVNTIVLQTRILEEVEQMLNRYNDLENSWIYLEKKIDSIHTNNLPVSENMLMPPIDLSIQDKPLSNREIGTFKRREFVRDAKKMHAITLLESKGSIYSTENGLPVGIAYASERQKNRWFLGLPDSAYFAVVFLCEPQLGGIKRFILSSDFYRKIRNHLSVKNNQLKFNVSKQKGSYYLSIPSIGKIHIIDYLENYTPFGK